MARHIFPQYEALQQISRISNLISGVERPALFANDLEAEEDQPDDESEQSAEEHVIIVFKTFYIFIKIP